MDLDEQFNNKQANRRSAMPDLARESKEELNSVETSSEVRESMVI